MAWQLVRCGLYLLYWHWHWYTLIFKKKKKYVLLLCPSLHSKLKILFSFELLFDACIKCMRSHIMNNHRLDSVSDWLLYDEVRGIMWSNEKQMNKTEPKHWFNTVTCSRWLAGLLLLQFIFFFIIILYLFTFVLIHFYSTLFLSLFVNSKNGEREKAKKKRINHMGLKSFIAPPWPKIFLCRQRILMNLHKNDGLVKFHVICLMCKLWTIKMKTVAQQHQQHHIF